MTPLRQPLPVHGHTPGLLCRGMPMRWPKWVVASGDPRDTYVVIDPSDPAHRSSTVDWSSPLALYAALHWLTSRGHRCLWMLPESHEGRVEGWDGLSAWEVSAILVSASVARVTAGLGPVTDLLHVSEIGNNAGCSGTVRRYAHRSLRTGGHPYVAEAGKPIRGPRVDDREAVLMRALSDGAALLVEGGVAVLAPGAP